MILKNVVKPADSHLNKITEIQGSLKALAHRGPLNKYERTILFLYSYI